MYKHEFTLDKPYYQECFDESEKFGKANKPKYALVGFLTLLGLVSIYGLENGYLGNFLIILAVIECISYYYRRPWWVARQMISRASGSNVTVEINKEKIKAANPYKSFVFNWQDITKVIKTDRGLLIYSLRGAQYLSLSALDDKTVEFILAQKKATNE